MELNHLKAFYETCKVQSFTKASEKLFISQSAISIQIKKLEYAFLLKYFLAYSLTLLR